MAARKCVKPIWPAWIFLITSIRSLAVFKELFQLSRYLIIQRLMPNIIKSYGIF